MLPEGRRSNWKATEPLATGFFTPELIQQKMPEGDILCPPGIPVSQHMGGNRGKIGDPVKPDNSGIMAKMAGFGVMPSDLGCQAPLWGQLAKATTYQQRTCRFKQADHLVHGAIHRPWKPAMAQFVHHGLWGG